MARFRLVRTGLLCAFLVSLLGASSRAGTTVVVEAPDGGEWLMAGETTPIAWHITSSEFVWTQRLWYSTGGLSGPWFLIDSSNPMQNVFAGQPQSFPWTVPDIATDQGLVRVELETGFFGGVWDQDESNGTFHICPLPGSYCVTSPNSTGAGATMGWSGSVRLSANDLVLHVAAASAGQPGLFYYGAGQVQLPFGDGFRCVGAGGVGVFRLGPPVVTDPGGGGSRALDYTQPPMSGGAGQVVPGGTWNFQFWYRDPAFGGTGFNLSNALAVAFCP